MHVEGEEGDWGTGGRRQCPGLQNDTHRGALAGYVLMLIIINVLITDTPYIETVIILTRVIL